MNALAAMSNLPEWSAWATMTAYMAIGFLAAMLAVVTALVVAHFTTDPDTDDADSSHGVAH